MLASHPAVREALVVGAPVTPTVNRLKAILVANAGMTIDVEEVRRLARERLSPHKVPRVFEVRPSLPRSPTGKVLRKGVPC